MLDVTTGQVSNTEAARQLVDGLQNLDLDGSLYIGYPVIAIANESRPVGVKETGVNRQDAVVASFRKTL